MAKQDNGYLGGFRGKLGPAVGYLWNGKWCLRSRPGQVLNPRSVRQMECRSIFKQQVQLAARMRQAVTVGLTAAAREAGMTSYNLFVSLNQASFSLEDNLLQVNYPTLVLSAGPVAPVAFGTPTVDDDNVLAVSFEKNPQHQRANNNDRVSLYIYCPDLGRGYLTLPVYRRSGSIAVALPDAFAGQVMHIYGFVQDDQGRCSTTLYAGIATSTPDISPASGVIQSFNNDQNINGFMDYAEGGRTELAEGGRTELAEGGRKETAAEEARSNPLQLTLW